MADLFDFMKGKKENKKKPPQPSEEISNYSIFMPVGVYDEKDQTDEIPDDTLAGWHNRRDDYTDSEGRRGDFNPYDVEKLKSDEQLVELKRLQVAADDKIKELQDKITNLQNLNSELSVEKSRYEYIAATYRRMVEKIVKIMPYYAEIEFTGIGVPEQWKDKELVEIFVTCIEKIKLELNQKTKELEQIKSSVQSQNSPQPGDIDIPAGLDDEIINNISVPDTIDIDTPIDLFANDAIDSIDPSIIDIQPQIDTNPIANESLYKYKDKIEEDDHLRIILETIGETGISRVIDLKETDNFKRTFVTSNGEFNQGMLSKKLKILEDLDIINVEKINTGRKGGHENIYSLSETGIQLYIFIFSTKPVENEKERIKRQHTTLEHGYFIKTVGKELEKKGYDVFDSPQDCIRKPLVSQNDGDEKLRVEADLIIEKSGTEYIIECEMGTTSDADMNKKLDKLILVTNTINFIMNNQESLNATSAKVDKWITKKGRDNLKGYTFRFTTIDTLKKKEIWQNKGPF